MVSWLIHHIFAVSIYFLKAWDSILEQFTDEWMWSYVAWCTTVNLTFHGMFTAFCLHQYRCHPCHCFFFFCNVCNFLCNNVDSLLDDSSEYSCWYNWVVAFCVQTCVKWFFFPHLSPHVGQSSVDLCFPFLP